MKHQSYVTRALKARDPRYARVLGKLGYDTTRVIATDDDAVEEGSPADEAVTALRQQYRERCGKKPFHGWSADELREKIAAFEAGQG